MTEALFHFARPDDWDIALRTGHYAPAGLHHEGFIHAATAAQVAGVVDRHLRGQGACMRLTLDIDAVRPMLVYEWSNASHDIYPHLYGPIPLAAVTAAEQFDPDAIP